MYSTSNCSLIGSCISSLDKNDFINIDFESLNERVKDDDYIIKCIISKSFKYNDTTLIKNHITNSRLKGLLHNDGLNYALFLYILGLEEHSLFIGKNISNPYFYSYDSSIRNFVKSHEKETEKFIDFMFSNNCIESGISALTYLNDNVISKEECMQLAINMIKKYNIKINKDLLEEFGDDLIKEVSNNNDNSNINEFTLNVDNSDLVISIKDNTILVDGDINFKGGYGETSFEVRNSKGLASILNYAMKEKGIAFNDIKNMLQLSDFHDILNNILFEDETFNSDLENIVIELSEQLDKFGANNYAIYSYGTFYEAGVYEIENGNVITHVVTYNDEDGDIYDENDIKYKITDNSSYDIYINIYQDGPWS